ncbi:MAG: sigma 54-interacting transcriptional regulator [Planctomycetaceae bacterium]|nr:sigma 54-interacting transcriptional regulator [Planctomycetaceae bacterium]
MSSFDEKDLARAREVQARMLPEPPDVWGLEISALVRACKHVGGDFYDFVLVSPYHLGVVIADVSGHGTAAALVMAAAKKSIQIHGQGCISPKEALLTVNDDLRPDLPKGMFLSVFYGVIDLRDQSMSYVRAGHPPAFLRRIGGEVVPLEGDGMAVGITSSAVLAGKLEEKRVELKEHDQILFYTDGLTEALNAKGAMFGIERVMNNLQEHPSATSLELIETLGGEVVRFRSGAEQNDDLTLVAIRVLEHKGDEPLPLSFRSTQSDIPNNLPIVTTSFIGRRSEVLELARLLGMKDRPLVTITGTGGIGKTRLSTQTGHDVLPLFSGGVWFVDLTQAKSVEGVCHDLAKALNVQLTDANMVEQLGRALSGRAENASGKSPASSVRSPEFEEKTQSYGIGLETPHSSRPTTSLRASMGRVLIILDNFEQCVHTALATVGKWLDMTEGKVSFLVTSRIPLGLSNEREYPLSPLALPPRKATAQVSKTDRKGVATLEQYAAVKLFIERAKAANPAFEATDDNIDAIGQICVRLDGIPLAIELAAARSKVLSPAKTLERLKQRFELLKTRSSDVVDRQATLRGAIDWSWELLDEYERATLAQLSVFPGGTFLEGAEAVVELKSAGYGVRSAESQDPDSLSSISTRPISSSSERRTPNFAPRTPPAVMDIIESLQEKNLLRAIPVEQLGGELRFSMYESIREYAFEKVRSAECGVRSLESDGSASSLAGPRPLTPDPSLQLRTPHPVLSTLERWRNWLIGYGKHWWDKRRGSKDSVEAWMRLSLEAEGFILIAKDERVEPETAAWAAVYASHTLIHQGPPGMIDKLARDCLARYGINLDDDAIIQHPTDAVCWLITSYARALLFQNAPQAEKLAKRLSPSGLDGYVNLLIVVGMAFARAGQVRKLQEIIEQVERVENLNEVHHIEIDLTRCNLLVLRDRFDDAITISQRVAQAAKRLGDRILECHYHGMAGRIYAAMGNAEKAISHLEQALNRLDHENPAMDAVLFLNLGAVYQGSGDLSKAQECTERSLELARMVGDRVSEVTALINFARIAALGGDIDRAMVYAEQSLTLHRDLKMYVRMAQNLTLLADLLLVRGCREGVSPEKQREEFERARDLSGESLAIWKRHIGDTNRNYLRCLVVHLRALYATTADQKIIDAIAKEIVVFSKAVDHRGDGIPDHGERAVQLARDILDGKDPGLAKIIRLSIIPPMYFPAVGSSSLLIGESSAIRKLLATIGKVARSNVDVLILGETGSGKELVARAIHQQSNRASHEFVAINCGALPETLLESELFGHEKGAFTGADTQKTGLIETASGGTLLLDEIGEMPLSMQVKLLRALQERTIRRVGGTAEIKIDVRVIAATMRDLEKAVQAKRFREDLYYRINVMRIDVPPLRERKGDIPLLAQHFLNHHAKEFGGKKFTINPDAMLVMKKYDWPGNVRELANAIRSAMATSSDAAIGISNLPDSVREASPYPDDREGEKRQLVEAVRKHRGNVSAAARELNLHRVTLHNKLRAYGIEATEYRKG